MMRDITNIQEAFVADHIAALQREGSALRAERERDRRVERAEARGDFDRRSRRVRFGQWLVAFGESIAGSRRSATEGSRSVPTGSAAVDDPCADSHDRLAPAA